MYGAYIKQIRKEKKLTQSELAGFFGKGYNKHYVSDIESGRREISFEKTNEVLRQLGYELKTELVKIDE